MKERRSQRSSSAKAASTNALLGTVDASGDLLQEGEQSLNFNALREALSDVAPATRSRTANYKAFRELSVYFCHQCFTSPLGRKSML
jgi:hypothetical protein